MLASLDLRQVQPPGLALVMAGELLQPAAGVLVVDADRGGAALLGLLVEETHVVHGCEKARASSRFRYLPDLAGRFEYTRADQAQAADAQSVIATRKV